MADKEFEHLCEHIAAAAYKMEQRNKRWRVKRDLYDKRRNQIEKVY